MLGPEQIPIITDPLQVAAQPDLATIGIMAHGQTREVAEAFVNGIDQLKPEHAMMVTLRLSPQRRYNASWRRL